MVQLPKEEVPSPKEPTMELRAKLEYLCQQHSVIGLSDLEEVADLAEYYLSILQPFKRQKAIDWFRQYFNLEFKMICNTCQEVCQLHFQDEITAPER